MFAEPINNLGHKMDLKCNLLEKFPTSDDQYDGMVKFCKLFMVVDSIALCLIATDLSLFSILGYLILIIAGVTNLYVGVYVGIKTKVIEYVLNMIVTLVISFIVGIFLMCVTHGIIAPVLLVLSLYANWKRKIIVTQNKRYLWYAFLIGVIGSSCNKIAINLATVVSERINGISYVFLLMFGIVLLEIFAQWTLIHAMKREKRKGLSFTEFIQRLTYVPLTAMLLLFAYVSIIHNFGGDSGIADAFSGTNSSDGIGGTADVITHGSTVSNDIAMDVNIHHSTSNVIDNGISTEHSPSNFNEIKEINSNDLITEHVIETHVAETDVSTTKDATLQDSMVESMVASNSNGHAIILDKSLQPSSEVLGNNVLNNDMTIKDHIMHHDNGEMDILDSKMQHQYHVMSDGKVFDEKMNIVGNISHDDNGNETFESTSGEEVIIKDGNIINKENDIIGKVVFE